MPDLGNLPSQYTGKLTFAKISVDKVQDVASRYGLQGLSALKFFCSGRSLTEIARYLPKDALKAQLDRMLTIRNESTGPKQRAGPKALAMEIDV